MVFQAGDYAYALSLLKAAARLLPAQPEPLHDLAWASFSMGNVAEARPPCKARCRPAPPLTSSRRQTVPRNDGGLHQPGPTPGAARVQQVLQTNATYVPAWMAWGLIQEQQGHAKEAEQSYEKVLAAYPLFAPAVRQLFLLYARDGNNDAKAYDYEAKAAQAFPDDADLAKVVGLLEYRRKNYSKSLASLTQSARKKQNDAELFWYEGMDYYALNQNAQAKTALQQAVALKLPSADMTAEANRVSVCSSNVS